MLVLRTIVMAGNAKAIHLWLGSTAVNTLCLPHTDSDYARDIDDRKNTFIYVL